MMPGLRGAITEDHLSRLVAQTHQEVLAREEATPLNQLLRRACPSDRYSTALAQERFHLVGEIKNCCPIEGALTDGVDTNKLLSVDIAPALAVHCSEMYGGTPVARVCAL